MKQNVLSMDNLLSLTAKGRLIFYKNKASNYGSAYIWNFGISPQAWARTAHQFQNSISKILVSSKVGLISNFPSKILVSSKEGLIPKFPFQNSSILESAVNSKIPAICRTIEKAKCLQNSETS